MADIVLRVTPEELVRKSTEFSNIVKDIQKRFRQVESIASKTRGYWQGEAGTRDRESFASYEDDIQFIIRRLSEHPTDLLAMAEIYAETETRVTEINAELTTSDIV